MHFSNVTLLKYGVPGNSFKHLRMNCWGAFLKAAYVSVQNECEPNLNLLSYLAYKDSAELYHTVSSILRSPGWLFLRRNFEYQVISIWKLIVLF